MQKKIFSSIILLVAVCFIFSAKVSAQSYLLGMIEVNFCNHEQANKELDIITKAGEVKDICVEITNKWSQNITLNLEFLDSIITSDSLKDRSCNASDRPKTQFGNFLLPYSGEVYLPAHTTIQKTYPINYPIGFSWLSHGCLAYHIVGSDIPDSSMLTVRIRSIKFVDIFVAWTQAKQMIKLSQSPILTRIDDEYIISFGIKNEGNVPENIHIVSKISNIFGYQKDFVFDTTIPAQTWTILTTQSFVLPAYGGPYRFKNKISYIPQFNFNITNGTHPSALYAWGTKRTQTILFVRSRQSRLTLGILWLFIYAIFRRKKTIQQ